MSEETIGRGTWYDMMAKKVIDRECQLGRNMDLVRTEMGLGASGFPHIGSLGDAARSYAVTLALKGLGINSELVAYCDDKDGLRKVPAGFPLAQAKELEKYLGFPVSSIPDPYGCHESYGKHMSSLLLESLDTCGIEYRYFSAKEVYEKGIILPEIRTILANAQKVGEIVKEEVGQERYTERLPFFPVCANCGRIYTTKAYKFDPKTDKVLYKCEGLEIRGKLIAGCGHEGEANIAKGEGKLTWKGEFAARWKALDIRFEAFGKDIADSVRINDRISSEVLCFEPPSHARYEMFLDKGGKKISKSAGNVFTPQVWFRYGSPQALLLLMLKRFVGTRTLDVSDIPAYMNEIDSLEDVYFGKKQVSEREATHLKGLYLYCWVMKPPAKPSVHVPYNLLAFLAKMAPKDNADQFIAEKLKSYSYLQKNQQIDEDLKRRIEYAFNWSSDFEEIKETPVNLTESEKTAIATLINALGTDTELPHANEQNEPRLQHFIVESMTTGSEADMIQNAIFNAAKGNGLQARDFFKVLYTILMGAPQGPRLGPYVLAMGKQNVIAALQRALAKN
jgi:lysyl-tRNA synthetase, class I